MSKSERIIKEIDWLQKIAMILMAVFVYVNIYEFELIRAMIVDVAVVFIGLQIYKKMKTKLEELEKA